MSLGTDPLKRLKSVYGLTAPNPTDSANSWIVQAADGLCDLAQNLRSMEGQAADMDDPQAAALATATSGAAISARRGAQALYNSLALLQAAATAGLPAGVVQKHGVVLLNFTGGGIAYEAHAQNVTGLPWVTVNSIIFGVYNQGIGPVGGGITPDAYNFNCGITALIAGTGFTFTATCPSAGGVFGAAVYPFHWFGIP